MFPSDGARTMISPSQGVPERSRSVPAPSEKTATPETSYRAARSQRCQIYPHPDLSSAWLHL
eukprot:558926-Pyramimonas_sp.AAC.1